MKAKELGDMTKVLVVDDDPDLVAICSLVLGVEGYSIGVARNGAEAYHTATNDGVDVVLMDVMMPVMDGITVCKMLKCDPKMKDLPVIIMSASESLRDQAMTANADAVIAKPFDIDFLVSTVNQFAVQ